jgi:hypothetical protein
MQKERQHPYIRYSKMAIIVLFKQSCTKKICFRQKQKGIFFLIVEYVHFYLLLIMNICLRFWGNQRDVGCEIPYNFFQCKPAYHLTNN